MFDHILVSQELLPLREAASRNDITALHQLADHVLQGEGTALCVKTAEQLLACVYDHAEFSSDLHRMWEVLLMSTHILTMKEALGEMDRPTYRKRNRALLRHYIKTMVAASEEYWDMENLQLCLAGLQQFNDEETVERHIS